MNRKKLEKIVKKGLTWARSLDRQTVIILLSITAALLLGVISIPFYIHYLQTRPIPLRFADEKTGYVYEGTSNDITIRMADSKTNEPRVELSSGTSKLSFRINETKKNFTPAQKTGDQILFADIQPKTDISYKTLPNGIKEEIILREPSNKTAFLFDFQAQNAYPKGVMKGFYLPLFYDDKGNYLFHMLEPFAIDAKGNRTNDVRVQLTDGSEKGRYLFIISINETWLADPKRAYPITIDPTIVHSTSADFAGGTFNRAKDVGSGAAPLIETYYQQLAADQYTVGLWHMDEASGNVLDSSGNGNTGTPTGTSVVAGRIGNGRSFNGGSDSISMGAPTNLINITQAVTVEAWIKRNVAATMGHIVGTYGTPDSGYNLTFGVGDANNDKFCFTMQGVANYCTTGTYSDTSSWHHIAATYDRSTINLYFDGVLIDSFSQTVALTVSASGTFQIGRRAWGGYAPFNGLIDEVRISNIARSAEEIKADASRRKSSVYTSPVMDLGAVVGWTNISWIDLGKNTGNGETVKDATGLVAQWNFNETSGATAVDSVGTINPPAPALTISTVPSATGGTITDVGGYRIHTFTSSGTLTIPSGGSRNVEVLVVGGGGGSGYSQYHNGGGGGGGVVYHPAKSVTTGDISITVGNGGTGGTSQPMSGTNGQNSIFGDITALGGGYGGTYSVIPGNNGGSGGGGAENGADPSHVAGNATQGASGGGTGYGYAGGVGFSGGQGAGGGGGAGGAGGVGVLNSRGGNGGIGVASFISGSNKFYGGGGGGANMYGTTSSSGGLGGGGPGFFNSTGATNGAAGSSNGVANTGGGAGGYERADLRAGATGGSGIVIVRYPYTANTTTDIGGYRIHTFTSNGTLTIPSGGDRNVEVLVVAGGGGSGYSWYHNGGGGGGGVVYHATKGVNAGDISVTVGGGGGGGLSTYTTGFNGQNSIFGDITALGGGYGGTYSVTPGNNGGSGGGGAENGADPSHVAGSATQGASGGGTGYGYAGGVGFMGGQGAGGGGGAGGAGGVGVLNSRGGNGGIGVSYNISGSTTYYSGGGGGANMYGTTSSSGGLGGGGPGFFNSTGATNGAAGSANGIANTGGGAGGYERADYRAGATGGSGVVIVRYPYSGSSTSFNGSLVSFASTGSQDAAAGTGWTAANKRWGAGALMFDGVDDEVTTTSNIGISGAQARTIEAWIKPSKYSATGYIQPIISWGACSSGKLNILGTRNNGFFFWGYSADIQGTSKTLGNWYHVVFTYDGTTGKLYVNGVLDASANITLNTTNNAPKLGGNFASCASSTNYLNGIVDSTRIYSRALSAAEILSNYQAGNVELQTRTASSMGSIPDVTSDSYTDTSKINTGLSANYYLAGGQLSIVGVTADGQACVNSSECYSGACTQFYQDADGDGFGNPSVTLKRCGTTYAGYVTNNTDCNDSSYNLANVCCAANGGACGSDGACCGSICGTDADGDLLFSAAAGHTGTCQTTAFPYTDTNDAQSCPSGANPAGGCNKCVNGAIANQTSAEDLFAECSSSYNACSGTNRIGPDGNCNGAGACNTVGLAPSDCGGDYWGGTITCSGLQPIRDYYSRGCSAGSCYGPNLSWPAWGGACGYTCYGAGSCGTCRLDNWYLEGGRTPTCSEVCARYGQTCIQGWSQWIACTVYPSAYLGCGSNWYLQGCLCR